MKPIFMLLAILFPTFVFAGVMNGGGDKSVVCRGPSGNILSAETLDLYEARTIYGLQPETWSGSLPQILVQLKTKLAGTMDQPDIHLFPIIDRVNHIMRLISKDVVLKPVDDAAEVVLPRDCNLEQLAYYVDDDLLLVSDEIWQALSDFNKAALIAHEAIYRMERAQGATDSRRTRKIVGHLFSQFSFEPVRSGLPPNAKICMATQGDRATYQFSYYPTKNGTMTKLQFYLFEGRSVFSLKTAILPIALPWIHGGVQCSSSNSCNISGGDAISKFETVEFITLGAETTVNNGLTTIRFYFLSNSGRHDFDCQP